MALERVGALGGSFWERAVPSRRVGALGASDATRRTRPSASVARGGAVTFRWRPAYISRALAGIQRPMRIIIRFSVSEMKPSGTLLSPPTQAHFKSRLSI